MRGTASVIFAADSRLKKRRKKPVTPGLAHYDSGLAIDIRYNPAFYATAPVASSAAASYPAASGRYRVEAFDDDEDEAVYGTGELDSLDDMEEDAPQTQGTMGPSPGGTFRAMSASEETEGDVQVWGTGELGSIIDPVMPESLSDDEMEFVAWGTGELEESGGASPSAPAQVLQQSVDDALVWGTGELEVDESGSEALSTHTPNAAAFARRLQKEHLLKSNDPETRAFTQDLNAILEGKKEHPSTTPRHIIEEEREDHDDAPVSQNKAYPSGFSHGVFDQMGNMSMAKAFDLGSFELAKQLDVFDRQVDDEQRSAERRRQRVRHKQQQSRDTAHEFAEDLSHITNSPALPRERALDATPAYDLTFDVPLIPQQTGMSCWAAGAAMLVGWRDSLTLDPSTIASATGALAAYKHGLQPNDVSIFPVWGMVAETPQSYSVERFYDVFNTYGPLWVAAAVPSPHIRVITGMLGDGTPDGTTLMINDPWETGMATFHLPNAGAQYTRTYAQFVGEMESLAQQEMDIPGAIYIAHLRGPRRK